MFIDASSQYTHSDLKGDSDNPSIVKSFVRPTLKGSDYSYTKISINPGVTSSNDYTNMNKHRISAPERLKRAMFKTSSKGIAAALKKK